jgi:hypothetical protein
MTQRDVGVGLRLRLEAAAQMLAGAGRELEWLVIIFWHRTLGLYGRLARSMTR